MYFFYLVNGLSSEDEQVILDKHNALRIMVANGEISQPRAINLKRMVRIRYDKDN